MNTLHFRYAVEIEKTRSITQAAENLFMAQPNLSKAIKELENTLGITIFKRTSKGVIPTEQGLKFLGYAKQVLIQIDNMEAIHAPGKAQKQKIKVSAPRAGYISKAFADFIREIDGTGDIEVYLRETNALLTIADVRDNSYNFGIIRFRREHERYFMDYLAEKSLDSQILWDFEQFAVMPAGHPVAELETVSYAELAECSVEILQGDSGVPYISPTGAEIPDAEKLLGKTRRRLYVFDRGSMLDALSTMKNSFALASPAIKKDLDRHGLIQKKCVYEGNSCRDLLIYPAGHSLSETEILFVNKLYAAKNEAEFGK